MKAIKSDFITREEVKKIITPSMRDKDQKMRFNKGELSLIKAVFADNEEFVFALRKHFFQADLSDSEKHILKTTINDQTYAVIKKFFLPELDFDAPLFQLADMINTLSVDMKGKPFDEMYPQIEAKEIEIEYLTQQMESLKNTDIVPTVMFSDLIKVKGLDNMEKYVKITVRNYLLSWIDSNLQQIQFLAGKKEESVDDTMKRLAQNSNK